MLAYWTICTVNMFSNKCTGTNKPLEVSHWEYIGHICVLKTYIMVQTYLLWFCIFFLIWCTAGDWQVNHYTTNMRLLVFYDVELSISSQNKPSSKGSRQCWNPSNKKVLFIFLKKSSALNKNGVSMLSWRTSRIT